MQHHNTTQEKLITKYSFALNLLLLISANRSPERPFCDTHGCRSGEILFLLSPPLSGPIASNQQHLLTIGFAKRSFVKTTPLQFDCGPRK